jgi:hypothetical protein
VVEKGPDTETERKSHHPEQDAEEKKSFSCPNCRKSATAGKWLLTHEPKLFFEAAIS